MLHDNNNDSFDERRTLLCACLLQIIFSLLRQTGKHHPQMILVHSLSLRTHIFRLSSGKYLVWSQLLLHCWESLPKQQESHHWFLLTTHTFWAILGPSYTHTHTRTEIPRTNYFLIGDVAVHTHSGNECFLGQVPHLHDEVLWDCNTAAANYLLADRCDLTRHWV